MKALVDSNALLKALVRHKDIVINWDAGYQYTSIGFAENKIQIEQTSIHCHTDGAQSCQIGHSEYERLTGVLRAISRQPITLRIIDDRVVLSDIYI